MRVCRHRAVDRELKKLKKYRDVPESLEQYERLLLHDKALAEPYGGLSLVRGNAPAHIFKGKVIVASLGGKSSGLRYVYEVVDCDGESWAICLSLYIHQQAGNAEHEVRARIKIRCAELDVDRESLEAIEEDIA